MKCPKCGYLGFEHVERCRNCGYDFSLVPQTAPAVLPELTLKSDAPEEIRPLDDLSSRRDAAMSSAVQAPPPPGELPLFGSPFADDVPLITKASPPRPPLAVRRATPERAARAGHAAPRAEAESDARSSRAREPGAWPPAAVPDARRAQRAGQWSTFDAEPDGGMPPASVARWRSAAVLDLLILAAIDAAVIYFTMQICGIGLNELDLLPRGPLVAFLLVQNGGYLVAFTAGGQTLGKMAAGIKVVPTSPRLPLDLGRAAIRELTWLLLAAPAGLGLLATVFARDRRGLHDRFAGTRVVRASL